MSENKEEVLGLGGGMRSTPSPSTLVNALCVQFVCQFHSQDFEQRDTESKRCLVTSL